MLGHLLNGRQTCGVAQCDFHHIHTTFEQGVSHWHSLVWVGDDDDRHYA
jgi:hypothetical protein